MKKIITILLSFTLALSMAACGDDPESSQNVHHPQKPSSHHSKDEDLLDKKEEEDADTEEDDDEDELETADQNEADTTENEDSEAESDEDDTKDTNTTAPVTVTGSSFDLSNGIPEGGFLLADNDAYSILLTDVEEDNYLGYALTTRITNKSDKISYYFTSENACINGVCCSSTMFEEVAPGESVDAPVSFIDTFVTDGTIGDISQIDLVISAQDTDYKNDPITTDLFTLYPEGESNAFVYEYEPADGDIPVFENDYCKIILTDSEYDDVWGYSANFYIENKTDTSIMLDFNDAAVNGTPIDILATAILDPGKKTFSLATFYSEDLNTAGITSISDIEIKLSIFDFEAYTALLENETISIKPEPISW